jgi:hypothetical protein
MFAFNHRIVFTLSPIRSVTEQKRVWRSNKLKYKLFPIYISKQEIPLFMTEDITYVQVEQVLIEETKTLAIYVNICASGSSSKNDALLCKLKHSNLYFNWFF